MKSKKSLIPEILIIFSFALAFITIFSKCSPFYPFNNSPDLSIIFEVGRRMFSGDVLYRDVLDQKGPFLFTLHGLASLISDKTYIGVYILEIILAFFTLFFSYKTANIKLDSKKAYLVTFFVGAIMYCYPLQTYGGDTAELMMMPFFAYLYYLGYRYIVNKEPIKNYEYLLVGITSGCVLWTKYTMLGIYIGWIIIPAIDLLKEKNIKKIFTTVFLIVLGVGIATIPWIIYFGANDYLLEFIKTYFFEQAQSYNKSGDLYEKLHTGLINLIRGTYPLILIVVAYTINEIILKKEKVDKKLVIYNATILIMLLAFIYLIGNGGRYKYYTIQMLIFAIPAGILGVKLIPNKKVFSALFIVLCCGLATINSSTISYFNEKKEEMPYYKFEQYIESTGIENPTMYGNIIDSTPFFKYSNAFVDDKCIAPLNMQMPEIKHYYLSKAAKQEFDFLVTVYDFNELDESFPYTLVMEADYKYQGNDTRFRLYESNKQLEAHKNK